MYTKEHSSYLRILEKGEEFEECIRVSAVDVTVECAVDVVVGAIQPATNTAPSTKFASARLKSIIYVWPVLFTDAYSCE